MLNRVFFLIVLAVSGQLSRASAEENVDSKASELYGSVMSPYCPGVSLSTCASSDATVLRNEILSWIQAGVSDTEIKSRLTMRFGESVLGLPTGGTTGLIAWGAPIVALILGLAAISRLHKKREVSDGDKPITIEGIDSQTVKRIQDELHQRLKGEP